MRRERNAFTLLELVLVLVIVGILAGVGAELFRPNYLERDARFVLMKIRQAQYEGVGYDRRKFGSETKVITKIGCLDMNGSLNETMSDGEVHYRLHAELDGPLKDRTLCFDRLGAPSASGVSFPASLTLRYGSKELNVTVFPNTGYATIIY